MKSFLTEFGLISCHLPELHKHIYLNKETNYKPKYVYV